MCPLLKIYRVLNPELRSKHHLLLSLLIESLILSILFLAYGLILEKRLSKAWLWLLMGYERLCIHLQVKLVLSGFVKVILLVEEFHVPKVLVLCFT